MSNILQIIEERPHKFGKFEVGRLLPFVTRKNIGPFVFIDHMGPKSLSESENFDVPPHPHIGLSTLTYLFEGCILHKDSLGTEMQINPFEVNWMTAGRGIVHSERTPIHLRSQRKTLHGLQIWVAMPKEMETNSPSFFHAAANQLPMWENENAEFKLIAGECFGRKSPVPVYSPLYLVEVKAKRNCFIDFSSELYGETGMYILEGKVQDTEGNEFMPRRIIIAENAQFCSFHLDKDSIVYLLGGEAFPEPRFIYWNFVSSSKELIEAAKIDWQNQKFEKVPGEIEFVPLPIPK